MRRTFGWRGAAAAYAKSAGGFLNSAAKSAEKLGLASGKAGKQLGYALHRTLSAEWLLRERDVVGLPQGLPELLDGVAGGALRDLPAVPAPLVALARRLADGLRGDVGRVRSDRVHHHVTEGRRHGGVARRLLFRGLVALRGPDRLARRRHG